jgi:hypothetical protein
MRQRCALVFALAIPCFTGNAHAKGAEALEATSNDSVTLPPQPDPPPGARRYAPPPTVRHLPPPPDPPLGSRVVEADPDDASSTADAPPDRETKPEVEAPERRLESAKDRRNKSRWYGATVLAVDSVALGSIAFGADRNSPELIVAGAIGYLLATPIVHAAHRKGGRAWGSVGLRLALPTAGAIVANDDPAIGAVLGAFTATAIDAIRAYAEPPARPSAPRAAILLAPSVGRNQGGVVLGGAF